MQAVEQLAPTHGVTATCAALGITRNALYRARRTNAAQGQPAAADGPLPLLPPLAAEPTAAVASLPEPGLSAAEPTTVPTAEPTRSPSPRALSSEERAVIRDVLNSERFQDCAPREVYATLLDEAVYRCSWRTMYRILAAHQEVRERRNQLRHPAYVRPELLATRPNQLWSWDITKLRGPATWTYYYLYVILDVYSRYVVGWMIAERENAELAEQLIAATCAKQGIEPGQLTIHADRGSAMTSKSVALLMSDLGVTKTHSRPHVSNDNPYSEAQFKTAKYHPSYPERFGCLADARQWGQAFFTWYNHQHHHTGLALLTPAHVHAGQGTAILHNRQVVLQQAYLAHPERFVKGAPNAGQLPAAVWINPPADQTQAAPAQPTTDLPSADEDAWPLSSVAPSPSLSREVAGAPLRPVKGRVNLPRPQFGRGRFTRFISTLDGAAVIGYTPVSDGEGAPTEAGPCAS